MLFNTILRWQGYPIVEARKLLRQWGGLSREELSAHGEKQKWEIFRHHWQTTPWYRQKAGEAPESWADVPILQKRDFQAPLPQLLSNSVNPKKVYVGSTSGSSGHPFFYAKDKLCHALTWMKVAQLYGLHQIGLSSLQARFYGIPLDKKGWAVEKIKDFVSRRQRFPVFDLSHEVLALWVKRFQKTPFEYLYGYTSAMVYFARYLRDSQMVLKELCPTLKVCMVTSEVCTTEDRKILEEGFGVPVVNEYGASELSIIAFENPGGAWELVDDLIYLEVVDEQGNPLPYGQSGRLLCTALFNRAMPVIRYEIGDTGSIGTRDGRRVLLELSGRVNDFVKLPSGKVSPGLTFYYISRSLLEKAGFINEFIIQQTAPDTMVFIIDAKRAVSEREKAMIQQSMDRYLEPGLRLEIRQTDRIERPASGKIKHFYSLLHSS